MHGVDAENPRINHGVMDPISQQISLQKYSLQMRLKPPIYVCASRQITQVSAMAHTPLSSLQGPFSF